MTLTARPCPRPPDWLVVCGLWGGDKVSPGDVGAESASKWVRPSGGPMAGGTHSPLGWAAAIGRSLCGVGSAVIREDAPHMHHPAAASQGPTWMHGGPCAFPGDDIGASRSSCGAVLVQQHRAVDVDGGHRRRWWCRWLLKLVRFIVH
ncbi:hypothetical protein CMUS01_04874 [Colletotrichum musicola]|uniref:Uncharacterized protein n=1 Tax=Colletotrichum musicola TaxID=2175873 RepID=A0A8H6KUE8_9PEZI|nr:hypothetical protein CMUS01_04874 [Colletotrichum musicola]